MSTLLKALPGDRIIRLQLLMIVAVLILFSLTLGSRFFSGEFPVYRHPIAGTGHAGAGHGINDADRRD